MIIEAKTPCELFATYLEDLRLLYIVSILSVVQIQYHQQIVYHILHSCDFFVNHHMSF